ncbi:Neuferricin [Halotydeus destructor]|nr:Neuferricin [Halotydeus destructor]
MSRSIILSVIFLAISVGFVYFKPESLEKLSLSGILDYTAYMTGCPHFSAKHRSTSSENLASKHSTCLERGEKLFTNEELVKYDGSPGSPGLYLAYLGVVYDVAKGGQHYRPGGSYHFFAGKDASKAFVTGDFKSEGLVEDVTTLDIDSFGGIRQWAEFYGETYERVGRLAGFYYDSQGCEKEAKTKLTEKYAEYDRIEAEKANEDQLFPPCNAEWSGDTNRNRLWCTKLSGGFQRDWVGVPRQLYLPKKKIHRCACVKNEGPPSSASLPGIVYAEDEDSESETRWTKNNGDLDNPRLREYSGCKPDSPECFLVDAY